MFRKNKKIDSAIIPTEIMEWFLDININMNINIVKNNFEWEEKEFFNLYAKEDFDSLNENSIFLILKYGCLLNFSIGLKTILNKIKNKINNNILNKLSPTDINNINNLIKKKDADYNFFNLIEINKTIFLDNNLFLKYPLLLLDIELNLLNYILKNNNNIIIPLNFDYSEKMGKYYKPSELSYMRH